MPASSRRSPSTTTTSTRITTRTTSLRRRASRRRRSRRSNASNKAYYPQVPLYAYDFRWNEEPAPWNDVYGAWHAEDLAFIFGNFTMNLEAFGWSEVNKPGRLALSNVMQQSISAFIRTGDPNNASLGVHWDQWTPTEPRRLVFDASLDQAVISQE